MHTLIFCFKSGQWLSAGALLQVSLVLPSVQDSLGPGVTYLVFAAIGLVAVGSIYAIVPETKGKTLEQIEQIFDSKTD